VTSMTLMVNRFSALMALLAIGKPVKCLESINPGYEFYVTTPIYSVQSDPRAANWTSVTPEDLVSVGTKSFIPSRVPLVQIILGMDLSSPDDLSLIDLLLYKPIPMDLHLVPVHIKGSVSNEILTRCYETIYECESDRERARDFLKALDQFTWRKRRPEDWKRVTEREARLACQVFTKNITKANHIIDTSGVDESILRNVLNLSSLSAIVNGVRIDNATIDSLLPLMVSQQSLRFREEL
jgi:hypothetical protein